VYRNVRHPIYSGVLLAVIGYVVAFGSLWSLGWAVLILVFFVIKSRWEDRLLLAEYGAEWESWAEFAGALLPRVSRR
jgi:protein-S-isoprenylcysteine O-methyltransferase Ste14